MGWIGRFSAAAALALIFGSSAAPAADEYITWFENYQEGLAEARKTGKPIFLEFRCAP